MVLVMKEKLRGLPGLLVLLVRALPCARQPCFPVLWFVFLPPICAPSRGKKKKNKGNSPLPSFLKTYTA